ncbi:MAG: hypothetical protein WC140_05140 [Bacteroidales bacterium]
MIKKKLNSKFVKNIKTLRLDLVMIFIVAILSIFIIDFWLIDIPELFCGGAKILQILFRLCFAYVSAFVFYFLVVHLKNQKDKENLYSYISIKTIMIISQTKALSKEIAKTAGVTLKGNYPDKIELNYICKSINPNSNAPLLLGNSDKNANWIQYFDYCKRQNNKVIDKILSKMQFVDSELVNQLAKIEDCISFNVSMSPRHIGNKDLISFESLLEKYFELVKDLEKYYNKKLKDYK